MSDCSKYRSELYFAKRTFGLMGIISFKVFGSLCNVAIKHSSDF